MSHKTTRPTRAHLRRAVYHTHQTLIGCAVELLWIARVQGYLLRGALAALVHRLRVKTSAPSAHDRHWQAHPAVATGDDLTFGQRAADVMKGLFATWRALFAILLAMGLWINSGGFGHDGPPFILLNLCLSCLAALQCFILLIAAKRDDQIQAAIALHTLQNTEQLAGLIEANTALTEQVATLTRELHARWTPSTPTQAQAQADQPDGPSSSS